MTATEVSFSACDWPTPRAAEVCPSAVSLPLLESTSVEVTGASYHWWQGLSIAASLFISRFFRDYLRPDSLNNRPIVVETYIMRMETNMKRSLMLIVLACAGCGASEDFAADKTSSDESRVESKTDRTL